MNTLKKELIVLSLLALACAGVSHAAFLSPLPGSRAAGKGGAFAAGADDASAAAWNPARLASLSQIEVMAEYHKPFAGLDGVNLANGYASIVYPGWDLGTVGASWSYFYGDGYYTESIFMLSAAETLTGNLDAGINIKYLYRGYDWGDLEDPIVKNGDGAGAFTFDLGGSYKHNSRLRSGLVLRNVIAADVGVRKSDNVPFEVSAGLSFNVGSIGGFSELIPEISLDYRDQSWGDIAEKINYSLGVEGWTAGRTFGLRCGINSFEAAVGGSYLADIRGRLIRFDYTALFPFTEIVSHAGHHRFSVSIKNF